MSLLERYDPALFKVGIAEFTHQYTNIFLLYSLNTESPNGSVLPNLWTLPFSVKIALPADPFKLIIWFSNICPANVTVSFLVKSPHNIYNKAGEWALRSSSWSRDHYHLLRQFVFRRLKYSIYTASWASIYVHFFSLRITLFLCLFYKIFHNLLFLQYNPVQSSSSPRSLSAPYRARQALYLPLLIFKSYFQCISSLILCISTLANYVYFPLLPQSSTKVWYRESAHEYS